MRGPGSSRSNSAAPRLAMPIASISQRDKGHCTIFYTPTAGSDDAGGASNQNGVGTRGFDLGIVHRF